MKLPKIPSKDGFQKLKKRLRKENFLTSLRMKVINGKALTAEEVKQASDLVLSEPDVWGLAKKLGLTSELEKVSGMKAPGMKAPGAPCEFGNQHQFKDNDPVLCVDSRNSGLTEGRTYLVEEACACGVSIIAASEQPLLLVASNDNGNPTVYYEKHFVSGTFSKEFHAIRRKKIVMKAMGFETEEELMEFLNG